MPPHVDGSVTPKPVLHRLGRSGSTTQIIVIYYYYHYYYYYYYYYYDYDYYYYNYYSTAGEQNG